LSLNKLAAEIHQTAVEHGWWGDLSDYSETQLANIRGLMCGYGRNFGEVIALIHSEASEALEAYRDGMGIDEFRYAEEVYIPSATEVILASPNPDVSHDRKPRIKPVGVPSELADIIIRVLDAAAAWNIDIEQAVREKMEYNKGRPYKHGRAH
jgi:hypothetical protein